MDWRKRNESDEPGKSSDSKLGTSNESSWYDRQANVRNISIRPIGSFPIAESSNLGLRRYSLSTNFYFLERLEGLNKKNSTEIILELIPKIDTFSEFLESKLEPDCIVLTIAILSKVCSSAFTENKFEIMNIAAKVSYIDTVEKYVANLPYEETKSRNRNQYFWNNSDEFFSNLADVCKYLIINIPTKACEVLPKLLKVVDVSVPTLTEQQNIELSEMTKWKIKTSIQKLDLCKEELEQKKRAKENEILPSNDFRTLSVYPTREEILNQEPVLVRKNIIEGKYDNVKHYLDVQFRLLKEDFVGPLRQDIAEYLEQSQGDQKDLKYSNIEVHPNVIFRSPIFETNKVGVIIDFSTINPFDQISSDSTRLRYGSLVCFTKDHFGSVLFGTVIERDDRKQQLIIGFEEEYNDYKLHVPYLMVEYYPYFVRHYHVLQALQSMSVFDFPMKKYIIDVDSGVELPGYLNGKSSVFTIQERRVDLFGNKWPTADQCKLNLSQYSAFKAALTQKFVVIQGPPGTGTTFLGLQIVKTLLHEDNRKFWYNGTPILIVSFTNHALDEFLLGLTSTTKEIVRVGNQSTCEEMDKFNLKHMRYNCVSNNALHIWKQRVADVLDALNRTNKNLKQSRNPFHLIHFKHFQCIDENITTSWFSRASNSDLLSWLYADPRNKNMKFNLTAAKLSEIEKDENREEPTSFKVFEEDAHNVLSAPPLLFLISKYEMWTQIERIKTELENMECDTTQETEKLELETYLIDLREAFQYFTKRMRDGETSPAPVKPDNVNYDLPHSMLPDDRWNLYFYWLNLYQQYQVSKLAELQNKYRRFHKKYTEVRHMLNTEVMKNKLVVGMTTTSAARLQSTLQTLKCPIVVVEEAAKVVESDVTACLTRHCRHLILIGDHQQLRPNTADCRIETDRNRI